MQQERRKAMRLEIFLIVDIKPSVVSSNYFLGLTKSISAEGFSFESQNYDMKPGEILEFEIKDPEGGLNIHVAGKIAWRKVTDFECLIGVKFYGLDQKIRTSIASLMSGNRPSHKELPVHEADAVKAVNEREDGPVEEAAEQRDETVRFSAPAEMSTPSSTEWLDEVSEGEQETAVKKGRKYIIAALIASALILAQGLLKPGQQKNGFESNVTAPSLTSLDETETVSSDEGQLSESVPELKDMPLPDVTDTALKSGIVETEEEVAAQSEATEEKPSPATEKNQGSSVLFATETAGGEIADSYSVYFFLQDSFASHLENFDDNSNNWQIFDNDTSAAQIRDGEYYIENKIETGSSHIFHYYDFPHNDDFMIETSIRMVKASDPYFYGMIFGGKDALNNYKFQIMNNNSFSIIRHQNGVSKELAVGMVNNISPAMHNRMRISKQGYTMTFYINGKYLARVSRLPLFGNKIGFVLGGKSEISVDSMHSRLKI